MRPLFPWCVSCLNQSARMQRSADTAQFWGFLAWPRESIIVLYAQIPGQDDPRHPTENYMAHTLLPWICESRRASRHTSFHMQCSEGMQWFHVSPEPSAHRGVEALQEAAEHWLHNLRKHLASRAAHFVHAVELKLEGLRCAPLAWHLHCGGVEHVHACGRSPLFLRLQDWSHLVEYPMMALVLPV